MKRHVATHAQHFLRSPSFIAELIGHSNIRRSDTVIDIGAGSGAIASVLARRCHTVLAYENEPDALRALHANMVQYSNVQIYAADFLNASLPSGKYKVFANIPFHLSSDIVRKLTQAQSPPSAIYLIVQKQFAQKLLTEGTHFHGALGMMIAPWWQTRIRRPLRRTDYTPPPAVDTVLLEIKRREEPLLMQKYMSDYSMFVERCYAEPKFYLTTDAPRDLKPSQLPYERWVELFLSYAKIVH